MIKYFATYIYVGWATLATAWAQIAGFEPRAAQQVQEKISSAYLSPRQREVNARKDQFTAVVYFDPGYYDRADMKREFQRIAETGFNAVRFHHCIPVWKEDGTVDFGRTDDWMAAAQEAGLRVIQHIEHFEKLIPETVLKRYGFDRETFIHTDWRNSQAAKDLITSYFHPILTRYRQHPALLGYSLYGEPGGNTTHYGHPKQLANFEEWLRRQYPTLDRLESTWNLYPGDTLVRSWAQAAQLSLQPDRQLGYGVNRDRIRFVADFSLANAEYLFDYARSVDPKAIYLIGSHQLFYNQAQLGWDHDRWAKMADLHFSSLHLSWHFEPVFGEVDLPVYLMARLTHDYKKGGWTSCYETTGGAVQYSGGFGNAMSVGLMRRLMLLYLAAGNHSTAFWTWNARPGGWEAGEYGMTTYSGRVAPWGIEAGKIAKAMHRYREELWEAQQQPAVGILLNWDNEALLLNEPTRYEHRDGLSDFVRGAKGEAMQAVIGISRALANHQIPFEYVTFNDLKNGLGARYPTLYAPHMRGISAEGIGLLQDYATAGGRLIADVQFAFSDPWGIMHPKGDRTPTEKLFGAWVDMIHDARTAPMRVAGKNANGFFGDLITTKAQTVEQFANGQPAASRYTQGRGETILLAYDPGMMCAQAQQAPEWEAHIAKWAAPFPTRKWQSALPLTFCLEGKKADHFILVNGSNQATDAQLNLSALGYRSVTDVLNNQQIPITELPNLRIAPQDARWLRCEK